MNTTETLTHLYSKISAVPKDDQETRKFLLLLINYTKRLSERVDALEEKLKEEGR